MRLAHLREAVEGSLQRLRVEAIELYQLHDPDPRVPLAESIGALADLQRAGKIRRIGVSNVTAAQLDEARTIADIVSVQNEYNARERSSESVLASCERLGIAFLPYFPLGGTRGLQGGALKRVARRHGASVPQIALAWLLAHSRVMLPIPGSSSIAHLEENVAAAAIRLGETDLRELEG